MLYSCSASSQNVNLVIPKVITIHKFIVFGLQEKHLDEFYASIPANLENGEIKYTEEATKLLGKVGDVPLVLQNANIAKAVVQIADEHMSHRENLKSNVYLKIPVYFLALN
jgi:NADPH-dependent curcumin reductase CurA